MANRRKTNERFLEELKVANPNIIPLEKYETARKKIDCRCSVCGHIWNVAPRHLLEGQNCPTCARQNANKKLQKMSEEEILLFLNDKTVSMIGEYHGVSKTTSFKCNVCGYEYTTRPSNIVSDGTGCRKCLHESLKMPHDEFIKRIKTILPNITILSKYNGETNRVMYQCNICGTIHDSLGSNLLRGYGCPVCRISKGEKKCKDYFDTNNIIYKRQYEFDDLLGINGGKLKFDFGILNQQYELLSLVEYDGIFHYEKQYDDDGFEAIQIHDKKKNIYCEKHNIPLLRIPYWEFDNVDTILSNHINTLQLN